MSGVGVGVPGGTSDQGTRVPGDMLDWVTTATPLGQVGPEWDPGTSGCPEIIINSDYSQFHNKLFIYSAYHETWSWLTLGTLSTMGSCWLDAFKHPDN